MIFITHRSWEYFRNPSGNLGTLTCWSDLLMYMSVGHVGRTFSVDLSGDLWEPFQEPFGSRFWRSQVVVRHFRSPEHYEHFNVPF